MRVRSLPARIGLLLLALAIIGALAGLGREVLQKRHETGMQAVRLTGGDPDRGEAAIVRYGCGTCHQIPGIPAARGRVGPPLTGVGGRVYLAGELGNTPANMKLWIQHPQQVEPGTAMPDMGVTDRDARDIAAYLYTLQ
jgi:cytochrome c